MNLLQQSTFMGAAISLITYFVGMELKKKLKHSLLNPLLLSIVFTIIFLLVSKVSYDTYYEGAKYISYLLTPATVCLAIPLYEQFEILKNNWKAITIGVTAGVLTSLVTILVMAILFRFSHQEYVTFLPKSITTAIGMSLSEEQGGYVSITVAVIIVTGILGNVMGDFILKICNITEPIAKGIALGTASHAIGTAKAMELGEVEGALSSLSIVVAGILTVIGASIFSMFL